MQLVVPPSLSLVSVKWTPTFCNGTKTCFNSRENTQFLIARLSTVKWVLTGNFKSHIVFLPSLLFHSFFISIDTWFHSV